MFNTSLKMQNAGDQVPVNYWIKLTLNYFIAILAGFTSLISFPSSPFFSIILVDIIFSIYFYIRFNFKWKFLFLLHPITLLIINYFFIAPFLDLGDGPAYKGVVDSYFNGSNFSLDLEDTFQEYGGTLEGLKFLSLGVAPIYVIPSYLYIAPQSDIFYLWQNTFSLIMLGGVVLVGSIWRVLEERYLYLIALFSAISPTFFELNFAPTRHILTFDSVLLFFISFTAINKKFTVFRLLFLVLAILGVIISKIPLLIPMSFFTVCYLLIYKDGISIKNNKILIYLVIISLPILYFYQRAYSLIGSYIEDVASQSIGAFNFLVNIPILGSFFKLIYALLSPFPWAKAGSHIQEIYGGNQIIFLLHMCSSLTGVYFFTRLIVDGKIIFKYYPEVRIVTLYGIIMSASILGGATGFHGYLSIYFPFFAPLLGVKEFKIKWWAPFLIVGAIEFAYKIASR